MSSFINSVQLVKSSTIGLVLMAMASSSMAQTAKHMPNTDRETFKLDYAISLYASSRTAESDSQQSAIQSLDKALVIQRARDYIEAWNNRTFAEVETRLKPVFSANGAYSDPGETAYGVEEVAKTAVQMHNNLKGLIREFVIAGEPELIEQTESVYYNVKNLMIYNWDWQQDGQSMLHGKELTIFDDEQMIHYDMGIFSTSSFPHFEPAAELTLEKMEGAISDYLGNLNELSGSEKYGLIEAALTHPSSMMNKDHSNRLGELKAKDLNEARFVRSGKASVTSISIAFPWELQLGDEALLKGTEINVFNQAGEIKYAFGFSGN